MKKGILYFALLAALGLAYILCEPYWLSISKFQIQGDVRSPITIAHISDLHLRSFGKLEKNVIRAIRHVAPDIILISGDTLDSDRGNEFAALFFKELNAPLGTFAVNGNWENWSGQKSKELFQSFGVTLLVNTAIQVRPDVVINGYDDTSSNAAHPIISSQSQSKSFCVALFHSPQMVESIKAQCPLSLAGHTHGGQIRLPVIGPLWLPEGSGRYLSGWYETAGTKMYVSRGIGTSILPLRFMSRPELVFITVKESL